MTSSRVIQVPSPAAPAAGQAVPDIWEHLAAAPADPDLEAALERLAISGDEVVARIAAPRVGPLRTAGVTALRSVAVDHVPRRRGGT